MIKEFINCLKFLSYEYIFQWTEPIIETPEQALKFLLNTDLDLLYIDGTEFKKI